jgi:hypothetical protein
MRLLLLLSGLRFQMLVMKTRGSRKAGSVEDNKARDNTQILV